MRIKAIVTLVCVAAISAHAADWYLDAAAVGSNNGTSWANAWQSPTNMTSSSLHSGDTLWIQGGNYAASLSFAFTNGLTIRIATNALEPAVFTWGSVYKNDNLLIDGRVGEQPLIKFTEKGLTSHAINIRQSSNVVLRGIEVDRLNEYQSDTAQQHAISIWDNCSKVTIDSCFLRRTTGDGININQAVYPANAGANTYDAFVITNTTIVQCGDDGIQCGANRYVKLVNCYIAAQNFPVFFGGHRDGIQINPDGGNIWIEGNYFEDMLQMVFLEYVRSNIIIFNNVFVSTQTNGTDRGINVSVQEFAGPMLVANNLFYNFLSYGAINGGFSENPLVANNIFLNCKRGSIDSLSATRIDTSNLWFDLPGVQYYDTSGNPVSPPSDRGMGNAVNADPLLVNPSAGNFQLQSGSPAIGAATNLNSYFTTDFDGSVRGSIWDIGAFEYASAGAAYTATAGNVTVQKKTVATQ